MKKAIRNKQIKVRGITLYPNGDALNAGFLAQYMEEDGGE